MYYAFELLAEPRPLNSQLPDMKGTTYVDLDELFCSDRKTSLLLSDEAKDALTFQRKQQRKWKDIPVLEGYAALLTNSDWLNDMNIEDFHSELSSKLWGTDHESALVHGVWLLPCQKGTGQEAICLRPYEQQQQPLDSLHSRLEREEDCLL